MAASLSMLLAGLLGGAFVLLSAREIIRPESTRRGFRVLIYTLCAVALFSLALGGVWQPALYVGALTLLAVVLTLAADGIRSGQSRRTARASEGERLRRYIARKRERQQA
jgi:hypothetical protein